MYIIRIYRLRLVDSLIIICLFCRISSLLLVSIAKETYNFLITDVYYSYPQEQPAIWREIAVLLARTFQSDLVVKSGVHIYLTSVYVCWFFLKQFAVWIIYIGDEKIIGLFCNRDQ